MFSFQQGFFSPITFDTFLLFDCIFNKVGFYKIGQAKQDNFVRNNEQSGHYGKVHEWGLMHGKLWLEKCHHKTNIGKDILTPRPEQWCIYIYGVVKKNKQILQLWVEWG